MRVSEWSCICSRCTSCDEISFFFLFSFFFLQLQMLTPEARSHKSTPQRRIKRKTDSCLLLSFFLAWVRWQSTAQG